MSRFKLVAIIGLVSALVFGCCFFTMDFGPYHNIRRYEQYLAECPLTNLTEHFPTSIEDPDHASVIYSTGPLQASAYLQLRLELRPDQVAALERTAVSKSLAYFKGGRFFSEGDLDSAKKYPKPQFLTRKNDMDAASHQFSGEFPDDFTLYYYSARQSFRSSVWETSGIAISTRSNEVVYWAHGF